MNIGGVTSKIEKPVCTELFNQYHIVCISELKTTFPFGVPGFVSIRSLELSGEEHRGGVAVLFRSDLWHEVQEVIRERDQIWFKLYSTPGFRFCSVYNAPSDSPYYDPRILSLVQSHAKSSSDNIVVLGDINARISDFSQLEVPNAGISYNKNIDQGSNSNGKSVIKVCLACDIKPLNHLMYKSQSFEGNLTYKKGGKWTSQLDWCLVSAKALDSVSSFSVLQSAGLPTDHAPIAVELKGFEPSSTEILARSAMLGASHTPPTQLCRKAIPFNIIDQSAFKSLLPPPPQILFTSNDVNSLAASISDTLYQTASEAKLPPPVPNHNGSGCATSHQRWSQLIKSGDSRAIWKSIDWKGKFTTSPDTKEAPNDQEFCRHYDQLMNPPVEEPQYTPAQPLYIPILDDPISPNEVYECINNLDSSKAAGIDGVAPGVLKLISAQWIILLTLLFNCVFVGTYPVQWAIAKVFNIYKKGDRLDPGNYRGISVMEALAKLYDMILSKRLQLWYSPTPEQAGAQKGRGCEEQILVIRLLISIARKCRLPLYIGVVDYQKAYDKVRRRVLLDRLYKKGCGTTFLLAISASLLGCMGLIGSQYFETSTGVRQGAATSCPLFVFFLDATVDAINSYGPDGWLGCLHTLLLMDDTVIFATSRASLKAKLLLLKHSADKLGMEIHPTKSRFMCTDSSDKSPFIIDGVVVSLTDVYTYLGSDISIDSLPNQLKLHFKSKFCNVLKFYTFCYKNSDAPFHVKKTVWESAVKSAIFYSSETWLCKNLRAAESAYMSTLKCMLGVRTQTSNDAVLLEIGAPTAKAYIKQKQLAFLKKISARDGFWDSYIGKAITLAISHKTEMGLLIQELLALPDGHDFCALSLEEIKLRVTSSTKTRHVTYAELNPELSVSAIYTPSSLVPEHLRIAYSRMRLSSHHLKIESGRWARIPRENRSCPCGDGIQTESHVLCDCKLTDHLRRNLVLNPQSPLEIQDNAVAIAKLCFDCFKLFSKEVS